MPAPGVLHRFSVDSEGHFSDSFVDFFDNPAWDVVRTRAQEKGMEMRSQGWSGAAMLPYTELEYGGFRTTVTGLVDQFMFRNGKVEDIPAEKATAD